MSDTILEMRDITKTFPGVRALHNVNFTVERGEIHCLVGENGAGKSTLMAGQYLALADDTVEARRGRLTRYSSLYESATELCGYLDTCIFSLNNSRLEHNTENYGVLLSSLHTFEIIDTVLLAMVGLMKPVDYAHFGRFVLPHTLAARGDSLYFCEKTADFEENKYRSDLFVLRTGAVRRLTASGDAGEYHLLDSGIVFASTREKKDRERADKGIPLTVLQRLPYDGGEAEEFLRLPPPPLPRVADCGEIDVFSPDFSAFVFKIQANMTVTRQVSGRRASFTCCTVMRPVSFSGCRRVTS